MRTNDCLQTPYSIWSTLGKIDLDPCAAPDGAIGTTNYALERGQDGLRLDWHGFVFCNPPFSQKLAWAERMISHYNGMLLLPERGFAPWFGEVAKASGCYWVMGQKINFIGGRSSNNVGSVLFLFGREARDRIAFSQLPGHLVDVMMHRPRRRCE